QSLADALQRFGGSVVLPAFKQWVDGAGGKAIHVNRPLPQFDQHAWSALVNVAVEPDGLVRRYSYGEMLGGEFLPSIGALLAGSHDARAQPLRVDFSIRLQSLPTVSYVDVLRGDSAALQSSRAGRSSSAPPMDFRSLLGGIAESRFQRIAMSLGDGLVCADKNGAITLWNPGAAAIFGYGAREMLGQPLGIICAWPDRNAAPFSVVELALGAPQEPHGRVMELEGRRKDGAVFPLEACLSKWEGVDGFQYGAVMRDISERKREAERIRYLAEHDTLTDLANRHALYEQLNRRLAAAKSAQQQLALLLLDLDKFKHINDTHGHASGDRLLCKVAERLSSLIDDNGLVARLSGDEFAVVIDGTDVAERAQTLCERICIAFKEIAFSIEERDIRINVSIGVALYPDYGATSDELFGNADLALYRAKAAGRGRHVFFERAIRDELEARLSLEAELARAVESEELELFYQPHVDLKDGKLAGAE